MTKPRYATVKDIIDLGPEWAHGCDKCTCGVVKAPPLTGEVSLYMERLIQAIDKEIEYCTCKAGVRYRSNLQNRYRILIEEAKRLAATDLRMADAALRKSHPDIDIARWHIERSYNMTANVPTIHYEAEAA